jgi:hypothetical protein
VLSTINSGHTSSKRKKVEEKSYFCKANLGSNEKKVKKNILDS